MSRAALALLGLVVLGLGLVWLGIPETISRAHESAAETDNGIVRHAFLRELNLDASRESYAVMLHPQATGGDMRVVTDIDALRAAQDRAFYTDDPRTALKTTLLSVVFLSPAGMQPNNHFVSVLRDKDVETVFTCHPAYCAGTYDTNTPHKRDLAGLLEASHPVELVTETHRHHDQARAALFRHLNDPQVVQIEPPNLPAPNTIVFPKRVILNLPAILLETDDTGQAALEPFDVDQLEARFTAAFTHAYPQTEAYRLGKLRVSTYFPPQDGWPIVSDAIDGYLRDANGQRRGLDRVMVIEPRAAVETSEGMAAHLLGPNPFDAMPDFLAPEPPGIARRLAEMAEAHLGHPCPDCFKIELPVATVDNIRVDNSKPIPFTLSYYRIQAP